MDWVLQALFSARGGKVEEQGESSQGLSPMTQLGQPKERVWGRGDPKLTLSNLEKRTPGWVGTKWR